MAGPRRAPTLQDVARRAGVHPATVSRALNHPAKLAASTREQVMAAVTELGYVPNESARRLAGGRAEAIGVLVPDIASPYFAAVLQAIQSQAAHHGLAVLIADTGADPAREADMLATLSRRVDGLVVLTPVTDLSAAQVPVVQVNRVARDVPSVVVDQRAIVNLAVDHLIGLGHERIAFLRGPLRYWSTRRRTRTIEKLERDRRATLRIDIIHPIPADFAGGAEALDEVAATGATGVVAFNDLQAAGVITAAREAGISVPDDLSVIGSDGLAMTATTVPPLTTVAAPLADIGTAAITRLVAGESAPQRMVVQPHLVVRASTAAPHASSSPSNQRHWSTHERTG